MKLLADYFALEKQIHDYFGYKEDWVVIPLDDATDSYWMLKQDEDGKGFVVYSKEPLTEESIRAGNNIYSSVIYTQRFLPRWVYRAPDHTMVCVDTRCDGNKFLRVFTNANEQKDERLLALYEQCWKETLQ